jgi:hypothetical protein
MRVLPYFALFLIAFSPFVFQNAALAQESGPSRSQKPGEHESQDAHQKAIVLYKSGVTEEDKLRVRNILHGRVTTRFKDEATEEITIAIPPDQDIAKYVQRVLKAANEDPAVIRAYESQSYVLQ